MSLWCQTAVLAIMAVVFLEANGALMPPTKHCMLACPEGQFLDAPRCTCVDILIPTCRRVCPSGEVLDPETCTCNEPVEPGCQVLRCPMRQLLPCQVYKKDDKGCSTCTCKCYRFSICPQDCENGVERGTDKDGCPTCKCKDTGYTCPQISCEESCPNGFVEAENGCPTCKCKPKMCEAVCLIYCPNGNILDENGCPTCKCKPPPMPKDCGPVCEMYCPFGKEVDARGCPLCRCKASDSDSPLRPHPYWK